MCHNGDSAADHHTAAMRGYRLLFIQDFEGSDAEQVSSHKENSHFGTVDRPGVNNQTIAAESERKRGSAVDSKM